MVETFNLIQRCEVLPLVALDPGQQESVPPLPLLVMVLVLVVPLLLPVPLDLLDPLELLEPLLLVLLRLAHLLLLLLQLQLHV